MRSFLTFVRRDLRMLRLLNDLERAPFPRPTHDEENGGAKRISITSALRSFDLPDLDAVSSHTARSTRYGGFHAVPVWKEQMYKMVAAIPKQTGASAWENESCAECGRVQVSKEEAQCPKCGGPLLRPVVREADGTYRLIRGFKSSYRRMYADRPAATITTASGHVGSDFTIHPFQNRLLSTLECALLQTFPRRFKWGETLDRYGHTNVRDMIGEAVPPAFTKAHGMVLRGLLKAPWERAPISSSDGRCLKAVRKLQEAANSNGKRQQQFQLEKSARAEKQKSSAEAA